jgi:CoA:oxalate CoA-transferase
MPQTDQTAQSRGPLSGVRVCDFTQFLSGPFGTQVLGDLGATVFKIESPAGDLTRSLPPYFVGDDSAYYLHVNRNKYSVVLDLKRPEAQRIARDLALSCDIVLENFRPGVMERFGLDYGTLSAHDASLIMCAITGFGQDGPYRDRPAYDLIVQAMAGTMSLTGVPDGPPVRAGVPIADLAAGLYGVIAVLAALERRHRTGEGAYLDVAMLDSQLSLLSYQAAYHLHSGIIPERQGRGHDSIPTYRCFTAGDDIDVAVTANTERMWTEMCEALEAADLAMDPRFASAASRWEHREQLWTLLEAAFRKFTADEIVARLRERSVPATVVNDLRMALTDPHVQRRGMVVDLHDDAGHDVSVVGDPIRIRGTSSRGTHRYPPGLGADTRDVLTKELGLSPQDVDRLAGEGVIGTSRAQITAEERRR